MDSKYEKILKVSIQVLRQDALHGHLKWKVTDLSRLTRVPRSRIYELLGKNKDNILKNALRILLQELYGTSPEREVFDQNHSQFEGFVRSREIVIASPELLAFYFRNRNQIGEIGKIIRDNETKFLKRVSEKNKIQDPDSLLFIRTFIHGVSLAPFLDEAEVSRLMRMLSRLVRAGLQS